MDPRPSSFGPGPDGQYGRHSDLTDHQRPAERPGRRPGDTPRTGQDGRRIDPGNPNRGQDPRQDPGDGRDHCAE